MTLDQQLRLERTIVAIIAIGSIILGFVLGHMEIATWTH
jgi:hypothetical protein